MVLIVNTTVNMKMVRKGYRYGVNYEMRDMMLAFAI